MHVHVGDTECRLSRYLDIYSWICVRCLLQTRVANWGRGIGTTGYADTSDQDISELQLKFLECFTDKAGQLDS